MQSPTRTLAVDTTRGANRAERLLARKRAFNEFDEVCGVHCDEIGRQAAEPWPDVPLLHTHPTL